MKRDPEVAYINLGYSLNKYIPKEKVQETNIELLDENDVAYCVDFFFNERPESVVRIDLSVQEYIAIYKAIQEEHLPLDNNISNIFHILLTSGAVIKSAFLSENLKIGSDDKEEREINVRLSIVFENQGICILNFDVFVGIILARLFEFPISITEKLFNQYAIPYEDGGFDESFEGLF